MTPGFYAGAAGGVLVALTVGVWTVARLRAPRRIDTPEAAADAADTLPGFVTAGAVVGSDGLAALAVDGSGRVAVLARRGKRIRACEIEWAAVQATPAGMAVDTGQCGTGQRGIGSVVVAGVDHLDVRRLAPVLARR